MKRGLHALFLTLLCTAPLGAMEQVAVIASAVLSQSSGDDEGKTVRLSLYPVGEPRAALKYQLLPGLLDRRPGNAAVDYGKVTAAQTRVFGNAQLWEDVQQWRAAPLAELRTEAFRRKWRYEAIFRSLDRAARREYCDWQVPIREDGLFTLLIPEAQPMRNFGRLLAVQARVQIAEGRFDDAVRTLQTGYAMARHVGEGETLIHALVGVAISHMMSDQLHELVQQPGTPNLYWALTMLPRPLVDGRGGIEAEMHAAHLTFPALRDVDDTTRGPEYWQRSVSQFLEELSKCVDFRSVPTRLAIAIKGYPVARRGLIDRGLSPEEVEAMPVPQVILLDTVQTYEEVRDATFKQFYVPYWQAQRSLGRTETGKYWAQVRQREVIPLATVLLPAVMTFRTVVVRNDRQIAALRTIEALRIYGAAHDGRLPEELSDVTEVPIPTDPVTGQPFSYQLRDNVAILEGPPLPRHPLRYEIKFVRP